MEKALSDIATAQKKHLAASNLLGAHLEGPYLSTKQCGAQGVSFITAPKKEDYTRLVEEYGKYIARWTYAPERDDGTFCRYLTEHGILASAGHTDAEYSDMLTAMQNGCSLVTHLYSCTSTVTRHMGFRHLGVIETAFLCDDLNVEIIADGRHLPKELVQLIVKIKGADHVALITDSLELAGTDVKEGVMNGTEFLVEDGVCKLKDRTAFAGSIATADRLVRFLSGECGFGIPTAVKMMTEVPARLLSCKKGQIKAGYDADLVVFNENIELSAVYVGGKQVNLNSI
jgi:N-acetylglucosamine-6-phosphate deacetylase